MPECFMQLLNFLQPLTNLSLQMKVGIASTAVNVYQKVEHLFNFRLGCLDDEYHNPMLIKELQWCVDEDT